MRFGSSLDACAYLHPPEDDGGLWTLEAYRAEDWLVDHQHGRELIYWREHLNACACSPSGHAAQHARLPDVGGQHAPRDVRRR